MNRTGNMPLIACVFLVIVCIAVMDKGEDGNANQKTFEGEFTKIYKTRGGDIKSNFITNDGETYVIRLEKKTDSSDDWRRNNIEINRLMRITVEPYLLDYYLLFYEYLGKETNEKEIVYVETSLSEELQFKIDFVDWFSERFPFRYMIYQFRFERSGKKL